MPDHYDRLENRTASARENALFRDLRHVLAVSRPRAPALRARLKGVDLARQLTREDLARLPLLHRSTLRALQREHAPFGGLAAARLGALKQTFVAADGLVSLEGQAKDWWGMGRALFAAGLRKGALVFNCFPYELLPHGHMIQSGACAIGCPVVPAGGVDLDRQVEAIERLQPRFYCGEADHLKALLDRCADLGVVTKVFDHAVVMGAMSAGRRSEFGMRGVIVRCVYALPEVGVVAFESIDDGTMILNEGLILEIVDPRTGRVLEPGAEGEIVITRINADYPLLRYATGALSAIEPRMSRCGRSNTRLRMPRDLHPDHHDGEGGHVAHVREIASLHPEAGRMQLRIVRRRGRDEAHLKVEHGGASDAFVERMTASLVTVTRLDGTVEIVRPGTLADDEPVAAHDGKTGPAP